ncbi:MAG: 3-deoxy-8-phosphooctulonate synthase [Vicinamibacterales bacterium]|mgnify:FL=1|jgi:2-dehydro-3-deoxyphosphooctonate aldolase (KDO 8-P synthase)
MHDVRVGDVVFGERQPLALIAGPCVIESSDHAMELATAVQIAAKKYGMPFIFKASFDKANRTSMSSFRGPGLTRGLEILSSIKEKLGCPLLTDIHEPKHAEPAAEIVDVLQIPAFLSRQTDLIVAAANTGRPINIKKGQFLSPLDVGHAINKVISVNNHQVLVTERGTSFGYNNLVVDMRAFPQLKSFGYPVIYDVTHSLQLPGGTTGVTGGQPEFITPLASAGVAAGVNGVFLEVHEQPAHAKSDGQNALPLDQLEALLKRLTAIDRTVQENHTPK